MRKFLKYLEGELGSNVASYYEGWIRQFGEYCKQRGLDAWERKNLADYLINLGRREDLWKVKQAKDAVQRYIWWRKERYEHGRSLLLEGLKKAMESEGKSDFTVRIYSKICRDFLKFSEKSCAWDEEDFRSFIFHSSKSGSVSKQNQELSALAYFYRVMLRIDISKLLSECRAKRKWKIVEFLSRTEVLLILDQCEAMESLVLKMMYGSGLRCGEVLGLKVEDINLKESVVNLKFKDGRLNRQVMLSKGLIDDLRRHLKELEILFELESKLKPLLKWEEYDVFQEIKSRGQVGKLGHWKVRRAFQRGLELVGRNKSLSMDVLKHSFAVHFLEDGGDVRVLQELLGHQRISQTLEYEKLARPVSREIMSPLDGLLNNKKNGGYDG